MSTPLDPVYRPSSMKDNQGNVITETFFGNCTFRGEYTGTNLIYKGFARNGSAEGDPCWQIAQLNYDGSNNVISILWPVNSAGITSTDFEFSWTDRASYTFS